MYLKKKKKTHTQQMWSDAEKQTEQQGMLNAGEWRGSCWPNQRPELDTEQCASVLLSGTWMFFPKV